MFVDLHVNSNKNGIMERLTPQEEAVMQHVWQLGECAIKDVVERMEEPKPPYTTVASIFKNLESKNYLTMKRYGNVRFFGLKLRSSLQAHISFRV